MNQIFMFKLIKTLQDTLNPMLHNATLCIRVLLYNTSHYFGAYTASHIFYRTVNLLHSFLYSFEKKKDT